VGPSGREVYVAYGVEPLDHWDRGFESRSRHGCMLAIFSALVSYEGRGLEMGRSPVQGIFPKCLRGFILSEVNSEPVQARGPNPLKVNSSNKYEKKL